MKTYFLTQRQKNYAYLICKRYGISEQTEDLIQDVEMSILLNNMPPESYTTIIHNRAVYILRGKDTKRKKIVTNTELVDILEDKAQDIHVIATANQIIELLKEELGDKDYNLLEKYYLTKTARQKAERTKIFRIKKAIKNNNRLMSLYGEL